MVLPQPGPLEVKRRASGDGSTGWIARVGQWIPAVESLHGYDAQMLRRDVVAGATVAAVAVPQAMAYATIFDMPMQMGFPDRLTWPVDWPARRLWRLLGNSLSISTVHSFVDRMLHW